MPRVYYMQQCAASPSVCTSMSPDPEPSDSPEFSTARSKFATIDCQLFGGSLDGLLLPLRFDPSNALIPVIISTGAGDYAWLPDNPHDEAGRPAYRLMTRVS